MDHGYRKSWDHMFAKLHVIVALCLFTQTSFAFLVSPPQLSPSVSSSSLSSPSSYTYVYPGNLLHATYPPAFLPEGFIIDENPDAAKADGNIYPRKSPKEKIEVISVQHLKDLIRTGYRLKDLRIKGNTKVSNAPVHPVVKALYDRKEGCSEPGKRTDGKRIALAVEGGGMRGCVSAGMVTAIWYLGLKDTIDVVYGSSAGSLIGAYFISGQLPYFGPEIYYDVLTTAGNEFIDKKSILRSAGLGALDLRIGSVKRMYRNRMGRPVLNLNFLLEKIVQTIKPLDWSNFYEQQISGKQELKIVASGLLSRKAVVMSAKKNNFRNVQELGKCMKASMLLPGVTGEVIRLKGSQIVDDFQMERTWWPEWTEDRRDKCSYEPGSEPLVDSQLFQPIPYRAALDEGCTHVITLRTVADGKSVVKNVGLMEKLIMHRFFQRKLKMPAIFSWMINQMHKLVYAEDMLFLNEANRNFDENSTEPKVFSVALPEGTPEVKRFETSRKVIFESVRDGFAAAYNALVIEPEMMGKGGEVARKVYPDSIMDQIPVHLIPADQIDNSK